MSSDAWTVLVKGRPRLGRNRLSAWQTGAESASAVSVAGLTARVLVFFLARAGIGILSIGEPKAEGGTRLRADASPRQAKESERRSGRPGARTAEARRRTFRTARPAERPSEAGRASRGQREAIPSAATQRHTASVPDVQEGTAEGAGRRRLPLPDCERTRSGRPVATRATFADTDCPATAEWRSLRLTGAKRSGWRSLCGESASPASNCDQPRSGAGRQRLHAGGRQRSAGHGPERRHHRPRSERNAGSGQVRERDAFGGAIPAGRGRRGASGAA